MQHTIVKVAVFLAFVFDVTVYWKTPGIGHIIFWLSIVTAVIVCNRFGLLLASADLVFAQLLSTLHHSLGALSWSQPFRLCLWLALFAAWLKLWMSLAPTSAPQTRSSLGPTESLIVTGSVNALLLIFLVIQVRYLFAGSTVVESLGIPYAEYARKGFFELCACIALILPLVMSAYQTAETSHEPRLRWAGGLLVIQALGLAASAFRRMMLYIQTYGLSVDRFYAAAGILVALTVLGWAAYACLRPRPVAWVIARQTVTVFFLLAGLSLYNVEDRICCYNLARAHQGAELDLNYLGTLSSDALPALTSDLSQLSEQERAERFTDIDGLLTKRKPSQGVSYNLSRSRAEQATHLLAKSRL